MLLHEAVRAGDDHRADRIRAHDVGIVVDLDPAGCFLQPEGLTERDQKLLLRGRVGELAAQRLPGVAQHVFDELPALSPLRRVDFDPRFRARRKRGAHQFRILDLVRQQNQTRRRLVVVELRQERRQHLLAADGLVGFREIRAVAPVLPVAEEEHLDAELPGLLVDGEDIRLLDRLRVDALHALDRRQGREPVAAAGRALEFERIGGLPAFPR